MDAKVKNTEKLLADKFKKLLEKNAKIKSTLVQKEKAFLATDWTMPAKKFQTRKVNQLLKLNLAKVEPPKKSHKLELIIAAIVLIVPLLLLIGGVWLCCHYYSRNQKAVTVISIDKKYKRPHRSLKS